MTCSHLLLAWTWTACLSHAWGHIHVSLIPAAHAQLTVLLLLQEPIARDRLHPSATPWTTLPAPDQERVSCQEAPRLSALLCSQPWYRCTLGAS